MKFQNITVNYQGKQGFIKGAGFKIIWSMRTKLTNFTKSNIHHENPSSFLEKTAIHRKNKKKPTSNHNKMQLLSNFLRF